MIQHGPSQWRKPTRMRSEDFCLHSPYYVNLASGNPKVRHSSIASLVEDLKVTELLGARY